MYAHFKKSKFDSVQIHYLADLIQKNHWVLEDDGYVCLSSNFDHNRVPLSSMHAEKGERGSAELPSDMNQVQISGVIKNNSCYSFYHSLNRWTAER